MVAQFAPAPFAWTLHVEYVLSASQRGYPGWKPADYPVIGWVHNPDRSDGPLVTWVSYKGHPVPLNDVLEDLRAEAAARAAEQHLTNTGSINYTLVPA